MSSIAGPRENPHIVLVHDNFVGPTGMGLVAARLASYVLEAGWELTVVGTRVPDWLHDRARVELVRGYYGLPALPQHLGWCTGAARVLRRVDADVVHVHSPVLARFADVMTCHYLAAPAFARGVREEKPGAGGALRRAQDRLTRLLDDALYRRRNSRTHFTFVSDFLKSEFRSHYGNPIGGWVIAPPAPPWDPISDAEREAARERWGVNDAGLAVGYFGGDNPRKGVDQVRRLARDPALTLLAAGPSSERLDWGGRPGHGVVDVQDMLAACDVVVSPSTFDSAPVLVLQALARGVPVVVSRTTGWASAVEHHRAGVVWDRTAPLADAVRQAATLPAGNCRALTAEFADERQRAILLDVYASVMAGRIARARNERPGRSLHGTQDDPKAGSVLNENP